MNPITAEDRKLMDEVAKQTRLVLQWWFDFVCNIDKQNKISDKQRAKLVAYDYDREMNKVYGCRHGRKTKKHWASGFDHDDMADYTGEPCAMEFHS